MLIFLPPDIAPVHSRYERGVDGGPQSLLIVRLIQAIRLYATGFVAGLSGEYVISLLGRTEFSLYVWILGGSFVSLLGVLMLLWRNTDVAQWPLLMRHTLDSSLKSMGLLGFIVGITHCTPLLGILTYITFSAKTTPDRSLRCSLLRIGGHRSQRPLRRWGPSLLSLFNQFSILSLRRNPEECGECDACIQNCPMGPSDPSDSTDCIRCHSCFTECGRGAIRLQIRGFGMHQPSHDFE